ncbi:hypothetical protein UPYG_G00196790 [Umbra pygmaea]|uniref:Mitochondrial fission factor n=1 Tax=Umbra pygmaea TaxID=75934 RepID=A0ABD0WHC9_UMBPY
MNGAAFPSPTAEMAEMNRIHYELEYTEGISQRMRIPEMLKMGPYIHDNPEAGSRDFHNVMMQVPERIVMSGDNDDSQFSRPRDLDLIQSTPLESLSLKTPPRVLTLNEEPLDFMELEHSAAPVQPSEEVRSQGRLRRERSVSENTARHTGQMARNDSAGGSANPPARACPPLAMAEDDQNLYSAGGVLSFIQSTTRRAYQQVLEVLDENHRRKPSLRGGSALTANPLHESRFALATLDSTLDVSVAPDDMAVVDAATLRRQIIKLNRRLQLIEEENKERAKREMIIYSVTVAFWLINSWVWFRR